MIWRIGDRPVDKFTVEERILRGLWMTGMTRMEARDWLKLHDTAQLVDATNELYQTVWSSSEVPEEKHRPKRKKIRMMWEHAISVGARLVWRQALTIRDDYWAWWKDRYQDELEKPDSGEKL